MSDFKSKVHNAYLTASYIPIPDLRIFGTVSYNKAQATLEEVIMPNIEDRLEGDLEDQDFTFEDMPAYSDVNLEYLNFQLGFEYDLTPEVKWLTEGMLANLWDYAPYVYGDETGSIFMVRSGLTVGF